MKKKSFLKTSVVTAALTGLMGLTMVAPASASHPPSPGELSEYKTDGTYQERVERIKKTGNHKPNPYLMWKTQQRAERLYLKAQGLSEAEINARVKANYEGPSNWKGGLPATGSVQTVCMLVDFPDEPHTNDQTAADVQNKLFGEGDPSQAPYESLHNYYKRASYGKLEVGGDVLDWYRAKHERSYYENLGDSGLETLIQEIFEHHVANGVDFAKYDNNHDGVIDAFFIKWTGPDTGWGGFWWAIQTNWQNPDFTVSGKKLNYYVSSWYSNPGQEDGETVYVPRTDIHETGHLLGLPDYYDYEEKAGPPGGVGGLDMMDSNWGDHNAFSKFALGWIEPTVVADGKQTLTLKPSGDSTDAVLIMPKTDGQPFGSEYFMAQYRKRSTGNDSGNPENEKIKDYPADGLLIWHVDTTLADDAGDTKYNNSDTEHKLLRLMEADGKEEIENGGEANAGDFYGPPSKFGPTTKPDSKSYAKKDTGIRIENLSKPGETLKVDFAIGGAPSDSEIRLNIVDPDKGEPDGQTVLGLKKTISLKAVALDSNDKPIKNVKVTWMAETGEDEVIKVDPKGKIIGLAEGEASVKAVILDKEENVLAESEPFVIKVIDPNRVVSLEIIDPDKGEDPDGTYTMALKKSVALKALALNSQEKPVKSAKIRWSTEDDGSVITINASGKVTAKGAGEATVTAYIANKEGDVEVESEPFTIVVEE